MIRASQFIGRQSQLADIEQDLYHIMTGQPRVVLVEGIAGIGKSRLLGQIRRMASEMGLQVSAGRCEAVLTQPCAPFTNLLDHLSTQTRLGDLEEDDILDETDVAMLRELPHRLTSPRQPGLVYHAETDKFRMMMAISRATIRCALHTPLLILVDDLHLADPFSLDLFAYLSFFVAEQRMAPLLLLGSYRQVALASRLSHLLNRLLSEGLSRHMALSGFDETETHALLRDLGVVQPTRQRVRAIHETTQGVPLFIEEVVPHVTQSGTLHLPHTIADAIAIRIASLPEGCDAVLTLAACLGTTFSVDGLQAVEPNDGEAIWEAIEAGIESGVLHCESGQCRFVHGLIRDAFQAKLHPDERRRLHWMIAQALETLYADDLEAHVLEIAHHLVESGDLADPHTVVSRMQQAGNQALAMFAWTEAVRYYEAAVRAVDTAPGFSEQLKADLCYHAGLAHYRNQDEPPAMHYFDQAERAYRNVGDMCSLAKTIILQTTLRFMRGSVSVGEMPDIRPLYDVLDGLGDTEPGLSGDIVVLLSLIYRQARQAERADVLAQRALELGRQANDYRVCALSYNAMGLASLSRLHVQSSIRYWRESDQCARQADDLWARSLALLNLPLALNLEGKLEEAVIQAQESGEVARDIQDWQGCSKALSHLASLTAAMGDFQATEWYASETMRMVERSRYPWGGFRALQALASTLALRGLQDDADQVLQKIVEPSAIFRTPGRFEQVLVRVFRQLTLYYQSRELTEDIASLCDELMDVVKPDTYSLSPLCAMIELGEATLNPAVIERPAAILSRAVQQGALLTSGWGFLIPRILGVAATMRGEWGRAGTHFVHAIQAAQEMQARPELARTYLDFVHLALLVRDLDDYTVIHQLIEYASAILIELEMLPHAQHAQQMYDALVSLTGEEMKPEADQVAEAIAHPLHPNSANTLGN